MPSSQQFQIKIGVNSSGVITGVNTAVAQINRLAKSAGGLLAGFATLNQVNRIIDRGGEVADIANKWSATTDFVQSATFAAREHSLQVADLEAAYRNIQKSTVEAIKGNSDLAGSFQRAGISIEALRKMRPEEVFMAYLRGLEKMPASARATADALSVLGKSGEAMLGSVRDGFIETAESAKALGGVIDEEVINTLDRAGDKITSLGNKWTVALAPGVAKLAEAAGWLSDLVTQAAGFGGAVVGTLVGGGDFETAMRAGAQSVLDAAKAQAEAASKGPAAPKDSLDASNIEEDEDKKKKKKKSARVESVSASKEAVDAMARIGIYFGRGGEIVRIPQQTLAEIRMMRQSVQKLLDVTVQAHRNGNPLLYEMRKLTQEMTRE